MHRLATTVALAGAVPLLAAGSAAASRPTPAERCAVAESRAAGRKMAAKLACYARATATGGPVSPTCLAAAETRFAAALARRRPAAAAQTRGTAARSGPPSTTVSPGSSRW